VEYVYELDLKDEDENAKTGDEKDSQ